MPDVTDGVQSTLYETGVPIENTFEFDPGVCILPIAEDPPQSEGQLATWSPVVVLRLHAPYRIRNTKYSAIKSNNPPVMPPPQDTGNFVFLGGNLVVVTSLNQSFNSFDWQVGTQYSYVENNVSRTQDGFVLGVPPWMWQSSQINTINNNPATPTVGAVAHAGLEVLYAVTMGQNILPDRPSVGTYNYNMPSYLPGTFFSDNLVNGGTPVVPPPSQS